MQKFDISTLILNWEQPYETFLCVKGLLGNLQISHLIVVIDNGSLDNSFEELQVLFSKLSEYEQLAEFTMSISAEKVVYKVGNNCLLMLVRFSENTGFAGGMNRALQIAAQFDVSSYFLLNNDARIDVTDIKALSLFSEAQGNALVGPIVMDYNQKDKVSFAGKKWPQILFGIDSVPSGVTESFWKTGYIEGSALLLPKVFVEMMLKRLGRVFDEQYFLYCEDVEICLAAKKLGFDCFITSEVKAYHKGSVSGGGTGNHTAYYYITRNRILLASRSLSLVEFVLFFIYYLGSRAVLAVLRLYSPQGRVLNKVVFRALVDGILGNYGKARKI